MDVGWGVAVYDMQSPEKNYFLKEGKSGTQGSQDKPLLLKGFFNSKQDMMYLITWLYSAIYACIDIRRGSKIKIERSI